MKKIIAALSVIISIVLDAVAQPNTVGLYVQTNAPVPPPVVTFYGHPYVETTNGNGSITLAPPAPVAPAVVATAPLPVTTTITTVTSASAPLSMLESYLIDNDTNYQGWASNLFTVWEAAAFQEVNGVPGASAVGNDLGLEVPIHAWHIHIDSVTEFETVFGDVHFQKIGVGYDYNWGQIQLSAGFDGDISLSGPTTFHIEPFIELKKAATSIGLAPFVRYGYPISKKGGAGILYTGLQIPFPKSWKQ